MNGRERITAALQHRAADRIPWAPLLDAYFTSSLPPGQEMSVVEVCRAIGADVLERHVPAMRKIYHEADVTRHEDGPDIYTTIETPAGTLTEHRIIMPTTTFICEPFIKSVADFDAYRFWVEHTEYVADYDAFVREDEAIGDDGLASASGPQSPLQFLIGEDMGMERVIYTLYDHPGELEALLEAMHEKCKEAYRVLAASPALVVIGYEDVSTSTGSPAMYRKYTMRYLDEYADIVHAQGKIFITHMCGLLKGVAPLVAQGRMDGIDSLTPPTTGDLPIDEARAAWPGKVIVGGLEPKSLAMLSAEAVREYTLDTLRRAAPGEGVILSTGDATAYGTPLENLQAVTDVVRTYGGLPLSI